MINRLLILPKLGIQYELKLISFFKGALSGLSRFLESPLKMMKNAFYFTLNALFVLKVFKILS